MPSVDELLNVAEVIATGLTETNDKIEIDADTRTMIIPETERIFGVMSDEKGERKYFRCKRFVGNGIDLSKLDLRVIYQNASGLESGKDKYIVTDLATDGEDYVTFSWELSRKVTAYKGIISFIVCAIKIGTDGIITNEWNTTLENGIVLDGLEVSGTQEQEEEVRDYYKQLEAELLRVAKAEYFNAKDKATGEVKEVQFIPPAPSDGDLGGISKEDSEQITKNKKDIVELNSNKALEINSVYISQLNVERKLQFSGTAARARTVVALLLICSQSEAAQPICIAFSNADVSKSKVLISSNAVGVTGGNGGVITIPRFADDWGIYRIVFFDKGLSVNVVG